MRIWKRVKILIDIRERKKFIDEKYMYLGLLWLCMISIFLLIGYAAEQNYRIIEINSFLHYHTLFEFISIIISFVIFAITYYTYTKNKRLRLLVVFTTFFMVGCLDFVHTMVYDGMQGFFGPSSIAKATTFWMVSRLILALGLLIAAAIPYNTRTNQNRVHYLWGSIIITFIIFYIVSYHIDILPALFIEGEGLTPLKIILEYVVMIIFAITAVFFLGDYHKTGEAIFVMLVAGLSFGILTEASFTLYKNVHDIYNMMGHVYKVISSYLIFHAIFVYNLDMPYKQLDSARQKLKQHAEELEAIVEQRTAEIQKANEKMLEDLEHARRIQESLLPSRDLEMNGVKFKSEYIPCENISGDFYNIYPVNEENVGMFIADVSGHGVSAALMTVFTEGIIKPSNMCFSSIYAIYPDEVLSHLYNEFNKSQFPDEMHIVIFIGMYNTNSKTFYYCSGGMNAQPILIRKSGEIERLDESNGFPICKLGNFYTPEFVNGEVKLEKGDRIFFYTDGLVDNFKSSTLLESETLLEILEGSTGLSLEELRKEIYSKMRKSITDGSIDDDITFFIMEV